MLLQKPLGRRLHCWPWGLTEPRHHSQMQGGVRGWGALKFCPILCWAFWGAGESLGFGSEGPRTQRNRFGNCHRRIQRLVLPSGDMPRPFRFSDILGSESPCKDFMRILKAFCRRQIRTGDSMSVQIPISLCASVAFYLKITKGEQNQS